MTLQNPEPGTPKNVSNESCEKSPAPLPVDEGTSTITRTWTRLFKFDLVLTKIKKPYIQL